VRRYIAGHPGLVSSVTSSAMCQSEGFCAQERTLPEPQIPHCRGLFSNWSPDLFGMTDTVEIQDRCDSPTDPFPSVPAKGDTVVQWRNLFRVQGRL